MSNETRGRYISGLPIMEEKTEQTNVIVEENGETKRLPASYLVPKNMVTTEQLGDINTILDSINGEVI